MKNGFKKSVTGATGGNSEFKKSIFGQKKKKKKDEKGKKLFKKKKHKFQRNLENNDPFDQDILPNQQEVRKNKFSKSMRKINKKKLRNEFG